MRGRVGQASPQAAVSHSVLSRSSNNFGVQAVQFDGVICRVRANVPCLSAGLSRREGGWQGADAVGAEEWTDMMNGWLHRSSGAMQHTLNGHCLQFVAEGSQGYGPALCVPACKDWIRSDLTGLLTDPRRLLRETCKGGATTLPT